MPLGVGDGMYSVEAWWNGRKWCTPFILSTYHKQLISQQVGPNVGAMVTVSKTLEDVPKPIFEGFRKLKPLFEKGSYRGPVRLDFDHANALTDIYAGFTFDNTEAMLEGVQEPPIDVLLEIAGGTRSDLNLIQGHYIAVRFQHIGWPTTKDFRIYGLVDANLKHCGLNSVLIRNGHHYCSQKFGPILKVTARGDTAKDAFARASRTITNLDIENICYRADLLEKYSKVKYPAIDKILDTWKDTKTTSQK
jgi:phosphoribosylamine-glycine ligase